MESDQIQNLCSNLAKTKIKTVTLDESTLLMADEKVSLSLVGKILSTKKINRDAFRALIPNIWKVTEGLSVEHCKGNVYVFRFNSIVERKRVLNGGPWSFNNSLIVLEEPVGSGELSKMLFNRASFWVQIHDLPVICMTKSVGWSIGNQLGRVEDIDGGATGDCLGKFLRVRINIDISAPLEKSIYFVRKKGEEPILLGLAYERMPEYCYFCGYIGHSVLCCLEKKTQPESVEDLVPNFGPELRAISPSRSRNSANSSPRPTPKNSNKDNPSADPLHHQSTSVNDLELSAHVQPPQNKPEKPSPSTPPPSLASSLPVSSKGSVNKEKACGPASPKLPKLPSSESTYNSPQKIHLSRSLNPSLSPPKRTAAPPKSRDAENPIDPGEVSSPLKQKTWKRIVRQPCLSSSMELEDGAASKRPRDDLDTVREVPGKKAKFSSDDLAVSAGQHCPQP